MVTYNTIIYLTICGGQGKDHTNAASVTKTSTRRGPYRYIRTNTQVAGPTPASSVLPPSLKRATSELTFR